MQSAATPDTTLDVELLKRLGFDQTALAAHLELAPSSVSLKVNGHRPWTKAEIDATLALCRTKDQSITYEQLFGSSPIEAAS